MQVLCDYSLSTGFLSTFLFSPSFHLLDVFTPFLVGIKGMIFSFRFNMKTISRSEGQRDTRNAPHYQSLPKSHKKIHFLTFDAIFSKNFHLLFFPDV